MNQRSIGEETFTCHGVNTEQVNQREGIKAFLPPDFNSLEEYLLCLKSFLKKCEPFIDLMIVDYFTTNSWESRMPKDWKEAFESDQGKLSSLDLMELVSLGKLRDFKAGPTLQDGNLQDIPQQKVSIGSPSTENKSDEPQDWPESLKEFVGMVKKLSINRTLDPDFTKFKDTLDIHLTPGMTPKKLHEVEILSGLMASYANDHNIRSVIDLGAGQGYLSRVLAFQHQLCVLGVDSNTIQTCGAQTTQKRTERLFLNKTKSKNSTGGAKKSLSGSKKPRPPSRTLTPAPSTQSSVAEESLSTSTQSELNSAPSSINSKEISTPKRNKKAKIGSLSEGSNSEDSTGYDENNNSSPCKKSSRSRKPKIKKEDGQNIPSSKLATNTIVNEPNTDTLSNPVSPQTTPTVISETTSKSSNTLKQELSNGESEHSKTKATPDPANDPNLATTPGSNFQLQHITQHITASTLPTLLKEHFPKKSKNSSDCCSQSQEIEEEEERWTLCGLHACGDLTSTMVKLYLESSATCLFSVGCCYHWISEKYDSNGNVAISDGSHGFPLSDAFNRHKAHLGEHAKMTACQSPERWLKYQKETQDAIHGHYYRALLHKLMVERGLYPGPPAIAPVLGRMGKHRLKGFPHYLMTAINRLSLPTNVIQPEEAQEAYDKFLEKDLYRIGILWALRTMLGPLYEGMILLDRATFLYENIVGDEGNGSIGKGSVQLVAGFDVVESPRNMVLIALKN